MIQINSGEYIGIKILKIKSIPLISILSDDVSPDGQVTTTRNAAMSMAVLLNEVYQLYKQWFTASGVNPDVALELTWITEPVENQPYKASIELYVTFRAIHRDLAVVSRWLNDLQTLAGTTLNNDKYDFTPVEPEMFYNRLAACGRDCVNAIIKEERLEDLQNQYVPLAYAYDVLPMDYPDLSKLANILIENPDCAVSFQLIPTHFSAEEIGELNRLTQIVSMLSDGVQERNVGTMSISSAHRVSELYKYYSDNKNRALYNFNILVYGDSTAITGISSILAGQISFTRGSKPNLKICQVPAGNILSDKSSLYSQPWVANDILANNGRNNALWQSGAVTTALFRFPLIITSDEAANFFRLPIGSDKVNAGLTVNETVKNSKTYSSNLINAGDILLGKLKSSSTDVSIGLSLKDLAKHMLIVGTPGSGKTTFSVGLLDRLWKEHNIPFLVIEPAKNEYRALVQSIPDLQVFTPGKNFISPFVFNPFVPPKNVRLEAYKSTLKTAFAAGVTMTSPLDKIFEDTVNNCYSDFRWLDTYTTGSGGQVFNIADFIKCFQETFDEIGYTGDARNIGRAGTVRLKSLANLFDNYYSIPIEDILTRPTVIELAAIENADEKSLIIALLLLSVLSYVNANYVGDGGLRNFILVEEAHVLLDSHSNGGEGAADPAAIAQGLVKRMLAEIRSYGVGLAIADQSPRKVGTDIVALTDIKVAFRLVESQDKQILADATGMSRIQTDRLARLKPGEAYLFFNRLEEAEEIITPDYRLDNGIAISLSDKDIRDRSTYWRLRRDKLRPYPECTLCPYCKNTCDYNRRILSKEVARRIFRKYIGPGCRDIDRLKHVLANISSMIKAELNSEPFSRELLSCVKVYLWRHVHYDTKLHVSPKIIETSLSKN